MRRQENWRRQDIVHCTLQEDVANLYIVAKVCKGSHYAEVTIINRHTYITKIVKDDAILLKRQSVKNPAIMWISLY